MFTSFSDPKIHTGISCLKGNLPQPIKIFWKSITVMIKYFCLVGSMHFIFFLFMTMSGETSTVVKYFAMEIIIVTESQNGWGQKRPLEVILPNPPAQAGHLKQVAQGHVQTAFLISPRVETPQPPWTTCAGAQSPSQ